MAIARHHCVVFWKKIQIRRKILQEGKLGIYCRCLLQDTLINTLESSKKRSQYREGFINTIRESELDDQCAADSEGFDRG